MKFQDVQINMALHGSYYNIYIYYTFYIGSKIVKRLRRRQYDPAIIERTIIKIKKPPSNKLKGDLKVA